MIITNVTIVTMDLKNSIIAGGAVAFQDDIILDAGPEQEILSTYPGHEILDGGGRLLMPGLINAHMHLYGAFARGLALKEAPPATFVEILERLWWRLDRTLDEEAIRWSALPIHIQAIRSGVTTLFDHHASPASVNGSLDILADAFHEAGLRACLCYEVSDRDGEQVRDAGIRENIRFLERCRKESSPLLKGMFGLHASFTLSDNTLAKCKEATTDIGAGFHVHCAEAASDLEHAREHFGMTVVERFARQGIASPGSILAHCVHITDGDMALLAEYGAWVVHNPRSNMNNAVGCAPIPEMMRRGITPALGTDGMSAGMMDEIKTAMLIHRHEARDTRTFFAEPVDMLLKNNARLATATFGIPLGVIEKGAAADMILIDYYPPTPLTSGNLAGHILFGIAHAPVDTTIAAGSILMKGGKLTVLDEKETASRAREAAVKTWKRFSVNPNVRG